MEKYVENRFEVIAPWFVKGSACVKRRVEVVSDEAAQLFVLDVGTCLLAHVFCREAEIYKKYLISIFLLIGAEANILHFDVAVHVAQRV